MTHQELCAEVRHCMDLEGRPQPEDLFDECLRLFMQLNICSKPHSNKVQGLHYIAAKWTEDGTVGYAPSDGASHMEAMMRCYVAYVRRIKCGTV